MIEERKDTSTNQASLADYFKEVVYGGVDGIITTFAVVAGFSGATLSSEATTQLSFLIVLLFGLANLFADAISMGLGNFLSVRSEQDLYRLKRQQELMLLRDAPEAERAETVLLMRQKGFTNEQSETLADIYRTNEDYWLDFMMAHEHEVSDPRGDNPVLTGFSTFAAFLLFGAIPILPFFVLGHLDPVTVFQIATAGTFGALVILGIMKWKVVGTGLVRSVAEIVLVGGTAAVIAYLVGTFFKI